MKYCNRVYISILIGVLLSSATATVYSIHNDSTESIVTNRKHSVAPSSMLKSIDLFNAGNYLMLECQLNGKSAYFMVDTGASYTVLHSKFAKLFNFQVLERKGQQTTGFGGNQSSVKVAIGAKLKF